MKLRYIKTLIEVLYKKLHTMLLFIHCPKSGAPQTALWKGHIFLHVSGELHERRLCLYITLADLLAHVHDITILRTLDGTGVSWGYIG